MQNEYSMLIYAKTTSSSANSSSSAPHRNGWSRAFSADRRLSGCSSRHFSKKSRANSSSQSGWLIPDVAHCMSFKNVMDLSLRPGNVVSKVQSIRETCFHSEELLCSSAHIFIFGLPKMVVSSIIASTSSAELKNGKRLVRKLSRITPQDQISITNG